MKRFGFIISIYILKAVVPYFLFSWLLLSVILFVQQSSRFYDVFFSTTLPRSIIWQLALGLIPNVLAFTSPIAILIGGVIGLSKLQSDQELTVMRAAGVGNVQIAFPVAFLGILLSFFAFFVNLYGVPFGARIVRQVALQAAILKLESPFEPGVFNTEIRGFTIYVKTGNLQNGSWEQIFIHYTDEQNGDMRLITSKNGRIDIDDKKKDAEVVLENATITTINQSGKKFIAEKVENFRFSISTKRNELIDKLKNAQKTPEELGLNELAEYAGKNTGRDKTEALILWQRRIILSITPLIFALLSAGLIIKFRQGNRGFGMFLALFCLIFYYLATLLGEQLARTEIINSTIAGLIPLTISFAVILYLFGSQKIAATRKFAKLSKLKEIKNLPRYLFGRNSHNPINSKIFDFDIISNLLKFYLLSLCILGAIFLIFTAFELWKFAGTIENGFFLLSKYLLYLVPYIYVQLAGSALLVATLATYIIKSRNREIVVWTAAGRSIYRILLPCFILMLFIGGINYFIQENVLPNSNVVQDELRSQIRSRGKLAEKNGKLWAAIDNRIYAFQTVSTKDYSAVKNLTLYQFDEKGERLTSFINAEQAVWETGAIKFPNGANLNRLIDGKLETRKIDGEVSENYNPFGIRAEVAAHLSSNQLKERIKNAKTDSEKINFQIALQKRYTTLFLPLVIILFTAPFAVSISRRGNVLTVAYAVGLWLLFTGMTSVFEQMADNNLITPEIAVWSPLCLFAILGMILISRLKT